MKYTTTITINVPIDILISLFDNPENNKKWMEGLETFETLSGIPGEVGTTSKLVFDIKGKKREMIETITVRNLPKEFSGTYETDGVWNEVKNFFTSIDDATTEWKAENEFRFSGIMKIVAFFLHPLFKKQSEKYMADFQTFAETEYMKMSPKK